MKNNIWKKREGIVYSTNSDFTFTNCETNEPATIPNSKQQLKVKLDKSGRAGKQVTLISGFIGTNEDLISLGKILKTKCGVGGSTKDGDILIQGNLIAKVKAILSQMGYKV